jgi:hypothetical protein
MQVFDVSTGSPVQVGSTIAMAHMSNGTYVGFFTATATKTYVINKAVYTDGTYTGLNTLYSPGSESFQASSIEDDVASTLSTVTGLRTDYTTVRAGNLDNLDVDISTRAPATDTATLLGQSRCSGFD